MFSDFQQAFPSGSILQSFPHSFNGGCIPSKSHQIIVSNSTSDVILSPAAAATLSQSSDYGTQNEGEKMRKPKPEELSENALITSERKQRRMMSNRESARRSRLRTKTRLENLRNQVHRLRTENHGFSNRLLFVLCRSHGVWTENDRLQSEYYNLQHKLSVLRQTLARQKLQQIPAAWPYTLLFSEQTPPLIA